MRPTIVTRLSVRICRAERLSASSPRRNPLVALTLLVIALMSIASGAANLERDSLDAIARDFVINGLVHFHHDTMTHLYIGEPELKREADSHSDDLTEVLAKFSVLRQRLEQLPRPSASHERQRQRDLRDRIIAFETRGNILLGNYPATFDEETQQLFGVMAPHLPEAHFTALTEALEELVPGDEPLVQRLETFRKQFILPVDKLEAVIGAAMTECRQRTLAHMALPEDERVTLHITHNQPFVGFTYYRGNSHSEIHLNADVPVHIERAIELGCHEGYPGHHVHATLLEQEIIKTRGWLEYSLVTLFGPLAVIAEGAASHAIDLTFTEAERQQFEREVLLPMAGLSSDHLERYYRYVSLVEELNFARNEAARKFLYDGLAREQVIEWLMTYGLETRATASQRLDFITAWRSYVVTYNIGRVLVRDAIEESAGDDRNSQWQAFKDILLAPKMPADLMVTGIKP